MLFMNQPIDRLSLDQVIDRAPLTIQPGATAISAINFMHQPNGSLDASRVIELPIISKHLSRNSYSYILVLEKSKPIGILTQHDVVRLTASGIDLANVKIIEVMTQPIITLGQANAQCALTALSLLRQHHIRHLPIVDEQGLLLGMVTERDLLHLFDSLLTTTSYLTQSAEQQITAIDHQQHKLLRQSQQDLSDFVENAIFGLHWVAADGTIIWANQAELDLLGYTREEYIGHSITEFHADQEIITDILQRLLSDQVVQNYEADLRCKDGSIRRVLIDSNSSWRDGEFVRTRCFTRDITDRKRAEDDLERFNQALSHAMEGIALLDQQGKYVQVNHAYANTVGYTTESMEGMDWQLTVHPEDLPQLQLAYQHMLEHGKVEVSARGLRSDGSIFYKQLVMVTAYGNQQQMIGHYCFMKDISKAKQAEADLIQSEQKFRAIFDGMFQFMGVLTPEGVIIEANRTALDAIAANPEDVIGQFFWATPWWTHSPLLQEQLKDAITRAAKGELVRFEAEHILADETAIFVDFTLKPIFDEAGKVIMLIPEGRDITNRKQAELELQNQKQDLARSNDELQQFAYVASHDLQEPLRMITSYLELLERRYKGQLDEKADKFIAYAVDGATRMQTLINDLLSYSRVGKSTQDWISVDCEKIVQNVLNNLHLSIVQSHAVITYDSLPKVNADPSQLTQLFQNLISNAIKFRREEAVPQIHIGVKGTDGKWLFSVQDNGIGMEVQYLERIFIIFQRLHSKTEYPGTGIGLAVCKKIVERHGGLLRVESQPDRGSTFYFTLPQIAGH
jgi:PAS domain S-box-containing protein